MSISSTLTYLRMHSVLICCVALTCWSLCCTYLLCSLWRASASSLRLQRREKTSWAAIWCTKTEWLATQTARLFFSLERAITLLLVLLIALLKVAGLMLLLCALSSSCVCVLRFSFSGLAGALLFWWSWPVLRSCRSSITFFQEYYTWRRSLSMRALTYQGTRVRSRRRQEEEKPFRRNQGTIRNCRHMD